MQPSSERADVSAADLRLAYGLERVPYFRPTKPVEDMTGDEIRAYMRQTKRRAVRIGVLAIAAAGLWAVLKIALPPPHEAPPVVMQSESVGSIVSIEVHHTTFSENSTVQTEKGIFQVYGAVSAAVGDPVVMQWEEGGRAAVPRPRKLCVASAIKNHCYSIE